MHPIYIRIFELLNIFVEYEMTRLQEIYVAEEPWSRMRRRLRHAGQLA
jgi:hypothetical protein